MDKLSELSKPVVYDYQIAGACIADGNDKKWVDWDNKLTHECPPDWMVEDGKVTEIKPRYSQEYVSALLAELEAKDKRIAELEAKLATQVRLPRPACTYADHSYPAYSRKQVEVIITSAGMRFTVEGDEQ